jgi:predicted site-specific integrase-resolvase
MEKVIWCVPLSQAAEMIGCRPKEVYLLIEQGKLDFIEAPKGKIKVSKESLQRYLGRQGLPLWKR